MQAYNHSPQMFGRSESYEGQRSYPQRPQGYGNAPNRFGRPGYGSGLAAQPRDDYRMRQGGGMAFANPTYRSPQNDYRAPENSYRGSVGNERAYGGYGSGFNSSQHSGGFHLFGGGHSAEQPKSFGHGSHSGWGGSSGGWKAPKESHSFGGVHSFGGGHSFSSHVGGSHSSGSHGGGHSDHRH